MILRSVHQVVASVVLSASLIACNPPKATEKKDEQPAGGQKVTCVDGLIQEIGQPRKSNGIIGGQIVASDSWMASSTVILFTEVFDLKTQKRETSYCTVSVLDRNVILTAAHCVQKDAEMYVITSTQPKCDTGTGALKGDRITAVEVKVHPDYKKKKMIFEQGDLAMLRLKSPLPSRYKPVQMRDQFVPMSDDLELLLVGYGRTTDMDQKDQEPLSLRATTANPLSAYGQTEVVESLMTATKTTDASLKTVLTKLFENSSASPILFIDQRSGRGICQGDSGGPVFVRDEMNNVVQIGVNSFIFAGFSLNGDKGCSEMAGISSVYNYRTWLSETFQTLKNHQSARTKLFE